MTATQSKYSGWWIHISVWTVILCMPLFFTGSERSLLDGREYLHFLLVPVSFMAVFYANYLFIIRRYLYERHEWRFFGANLLLVVAVMMVVHLLSRYVVPLDFHPRAEHPRPDVVRFFIGNAVLYLLVVGVSVAIRMTGGWYRAEAARQQLEHIHMQAELQNLKSQLNPHFLFNTLNNIYSLIQIDTDRAQQTVHDLSRLLRYVLYDSSQPTVPLRAEIDFLRDYIELMRIRLPRHVRLRVELPEGASETPVAPLLFISLVENAFKHGVSNDRPSHIFISIREQESELIGEIENSCFPKSAETDRSGSGIGLKNLVKRLEMIYPGRHGFTFGQSGETYRARLSLKPRKG